MPLTLPWVDVTFDDVLACALSPVLDAARTAALSEGQTDPYLALAPGIIARVRNKVATHPGNRLSTAPGRVPPELKDQTALLIAAALQLRLSKLVGAAELSQDQRDAVRRAEADLNDAARGAFAVSLPDDAAATVPVARASSYQTLVPGNAGESRDDLSRL